MVKIDQHLGIKLDEFGEVVTSKRTKQKETKLTCDMKLHVVDLMTLLIHKQQEVIKVLTKETTKETKKSIKKKRKATKYDKELIDTCIRELTANKGTSKEIVFVKDSHKTDVKGKLFIDNKIKDILTGIEVNLET